MKTKKKLRKFRVWTEQVNQEIWDVMATDEEDAKEKAFRKFRKEVYPRISYVQPA